jgi:hypothetical protein
MSHLFTAILPRAVVISRIFRPSGAALVAGLRMSLSLPALTGLAASASAQGGSGSPRTGGPGSDVHTEKPDLRASPAAAPAQHPLLDSLVAVERKSWEAWQRRDSAFFQRVLSDDHVEVGAGGVTGKSSAVAGVGSPACVAASYAVDGFRLTLLNEQTAVLTYRAEQNTTCGGNPVPSPAWATSVYVRRGDRWLNAVFQQTPARRR